jgi:hypothetical protein
MKYVRDRHQRSLSLEGDGHDHVLKGMGEQLFGRNAYDDEARDDLKHLENHAEQFRAIGLEV